MRIRQAKLLSNPGKKIRWSVLPPNFYEKIRLPDERSMAPQLAGLAEPYPYFWDVDFLYIPLWIRQRDWLLVRVDLRRMEITQYWTDNRWRNEMRHAVRDYMAVFQIFFKSLLDRMHYWRNVTETPLSREISVGLVELDVPQDKGNVANAGVVVSMTMENLVRNKPLMVEGDVGEACVNYRRHMADELYRWRCVPMAP